ncbi:MAG: GAF domain-containing protein [Leptolyngbya sp. PLA3]|nr:MAG: GAF domain-containing protein [Cyanobacteria bacterium CYA]MCE7969886.1 GAF domain-containing protein [Leptolyngbya sp. PL-A3]
MNSGCQGKSALSISAFLTDGTLARLCAELEAMIGRPVRLRDERGRRILSVEGPTPWRIDESDVLSADELAAGFPLFVDGQTIGTITLDPGQLTLSSDAPARLGRALRLIAATASELCADVVELRHRVIALEMLYHVSSLLASGANLEQVLEATLDAALRALELDAGSVVLFPEDSDRLPASDHEEELRLIASRNLSQDWLTSPLPLSRHRIFDRKVMAGEVVSVPDLLNHPDVLDAQRCRMEGLGSFLSAGVVYRDRIAGVIRLYGCEARPFSEQDRTLLRSLGQQAGAAVNQARLLEIQAEEKRIQRQLALAMDIQARMLPRRMPTIPTLDIAARCEPCFELGGDFYDLIPLGESIGIAIGDVAGKGIGAALLMSAVRASLRAYADDVYDLDEVLARVNEAMVRDTLSNEFATIWYGVIDPLTLTMTYGSAGHDPPLLVRKRRTDENQIEELRSTGLVIGVLPNQKYDRRISRLEPGDVMVAYTDGLPDAADFQGRRYGRARLRAGLLSILKTHPTASAERILDHLLWDTRRYAGLAPQRDDETLVVVRVRD